MLLAGAALGLAVNRASPHRLPLFPRVVDSAPTPRLALPDGVQPLSLERARAMFDGKEALFLDARGSDEYTDGHIPGAVNLPPTEFFTRYPDLAPEVEAAPAVVIYCRSVECHDAVALAALLKEVTDRPLFVFEEGWRVWQEAGYPASRGRQP